MHDKKYTDSKKQNQRIKSAKTKEGKEYQRESKWIKSQWIYVSFKQDLKVTSDGANLICNGKRFQSLTCSLRQKDPNLGYCLLVADHGEAREIEEKWSLLSAR